MNVNICILTGLKARHGSGVFNGPVDGQRRGQAQRDLAGLL